MKAARRLVNDIRMALQARSLGPQVDAAAMATQYAARCREVNERLHLCQQYINNGMLTEAMHAAERVLQGIACDLSLNNHGV